MFWKRMKNSLKGMAVVLFLFAAMGLQAFASNGSVTVEGYDGEPGDTFTVYVTVSGEDAGLGAFDARLSYDTSMLTFQGGSGENAQMWDAMKKSSSSDISSSLIPPRISPTSPPLSRIAW